MTRSLFLPTMEFVGLGKIHQPGASNKSSGPAQPTWISQVLILSSIAGRRVVWLRSYYFKCQSSRHTDSNYVELENRVRLRPSPYRPPRSCHSQKSCLRPFLSCPSTIIRDWYCLSILIHTRSILKRSRDSTHHPRPLAVIVRICIF